MARKNKYAEFSQLGKGSNGGTATATKPGKKATTRMGEGLSNHQKKRLKLGKSLIQPPIPGRRDPSRSFRSIWDY